MRRIATSGSRLFSEPSRSRLSTARFKEAAGRLARREPIRFVAAGGLASAINWASRFPLSLIFPFEIAVALAYGVGMVAGFVLYRSWVFSGSRVRLGQQVWRFLLVNGVGLTVVLSSARGFLWLLTALSVGSEAAAQALAHGFALVVGAVFNFIGHRSLTFCRKPLPHR